MQSPNTPSLVDLPDELLENIVDRLDDESLIQLSMTCKRLHFFVLPIVFARANILEGNIDDATCFYLHDPPAHILRALQLALFIQNVDSLGIDFGYPASTILPYARELNKLVSRLPSVKRFYLNLSHSLSPSAPNPGWQKEVLLLLDLVVNRSCVLLSVDGGDGITGDYTPATGSQSSRHVNPIDRQIRCILRRLDGAVRSMASLGRRNHHRGLREFRALSVVLLHPPFLDWTISTLQSNSQTLTAVSFEIDRTPADTWHYILSSITLPFLSRFKLSPDGVVVEQRTVKFGDVLGFLTRHPSIVDLDLYGITLPGGPQPQTLLPALQILRADPWLISWFLACEQPFRYLTSLEMVSEYSQDLNFPFGSNTNTFDNALGLLPHSAPQVNTLHITLYPEAGIAEWLEKQISQPEETSPLAALERVTTLNLFQSRNMWQSDVVALMPHFLARFSGLQHLIYAPPPPGVERAIRTSFIREIKLACPGMKIVTVETGSPVDIDTLSLDPD
ncbi:uncharacterized protein LACBIDRAFT_330804 [Laccaria bicolor S238N-H82]|uniref:Predicted protein n=1 Tax=Laccaria bicolor (strain S238N-H82 / ATCC MYA-4686) TaxID=486041 RepID=B0DMI6_LACBS|nr:uncharacterized protein LACBIDRAFT_330804 [Laccaria bicolor S238N-H82]EDR04297.1 predicted protein [Laccaria bicolor S238N-H82]|eukprot:XP_001885188.1 predicted protein [Laccaria bicolor S238N-H82]